MNHTLTRLLLLLLLTAPAVSGQQPATGDMAVGPKSIILIIADGTGIGQHTYAYYLGGHFSLQRFEHVGLMRRVDRSRAFDQIDLFHAGSVAPIDHERVGVFARIGERAAARCQI